MKKMHKVYTCADCDKIFDKIRYFKVHSYNLSYTNTDKNRDEFKNCYFDTGCVDSIEVTPLRCRYMAGGSHALPIRGLEKDLKQIRLKSKSKKDSIYLGPI